MTPIQVVGIGLDGAAGLTDSVRQIVDRATLLVGSSRHLSYFPDHAADRLTLGNLNTAIHQIQQYLSPPPTGTPTINGQPSTANSRSVVILTSGDPLFFGFGRLLLANFSPELLTFHPHLSSVQLACNRLKIPWQDIRTISAHGRSLDELTQALQQGTEKVAVLTDESHSPTAIAQLIQALDLPNAYSLHVCENLGGSEENIDSFTLNSSAEFAQLQNRHFAPLNIVVLQRLSEVQPFDLETLPLFGLPDHAFLSFGDRPGLMTKREVRIVVLGELALQPGQVVWDIGAGTGSVAIEVARLCPTSHLYAIEKTAAGVTLIQQNCQRLQVKNLTPICGTAPDSLVDLPTPDRIFIGGSGGNLKSILDICKTRLAPKGTIVLALATLEHLTATLTWLDTIAPSDLSHRILQVQIARSTPIASLTRLTPLNPVTLVRIWRN
jgi:precorrin-6B C5,15-methyltransferase / cobalt-precorrin-6B C5,C15-methyltransferase